MNISQSSIDFGMMTIDSLACRNVVISNSGFDTLELNIEISGEDTAYFDFNPRNLIVNAGQSDTINVCFLPDKIIEFEALLAIKSNAGDASITLLGEGVSNTSIDAHDKIIPDKIMIHQNYPNPFNPNTSIRFNLPKSSEVTLTVYTLLGEEIQTLIKEEMPAGAHQVEWDAKDLASGIYLYRLEAEDFVQTRKMVVMK